MKKFLLSLAAVALTSGMAMASDAVVEVSFGKNGNVSAANNSGYTDTRVYTGKADTPIEGKSWTVVNFNNNNNGWNDFIKCGRKGNASVGTVATDFTIPEAVDEVVVNIPSWTKSNVNSIKVYTSTDATTWTEVATGDKNSLANSELSIAIAKPVANLYYKVGFDCASGSGNGLISLHSITYKGQLLVGDKKYADLAFPASSYSIVHGDAFGAPALENPNNLAVTYTSSNPEVATVDANGAVKIVGFYGTTTITAESAESDEYYAGKASYKLTVIGKAYNMQKLIEYCPTSGSEAVVMFPMTVVYVNGQYVYVVDNSDNASLIFLNTTYNVGDVIPAGWTATYSPYNGLPEFKMSETPEVETTTSVNYARVNSVTEADMNRVVILKNVTFSAATPDAKSSFTGTLADGSTLTFYNSFTVPSVDAGKYNVMIAVARFNTTFQVYPIEYTLVPDTSKEPTAVPKQLSATTNNGTISYGRLEAGDEGMIVNLKGATGDKVTVVLDIPEGFTNWYILNPGDIEVGEFATRSLDDQGQWLAISDIETIISGVEGNELTFTVGDKPATHYLSAFPVWNDQVFYGYDGAYNFDINIAVDNTVGVEAIEAAEADAEYYTLQGVKVVNPEKGIFIKVANGKAVKVIL